MNCLQLYVVSRSKGACSHSVYQCPFSIASNEQRAHVTVCRCLEKNQCSQHTISEHSVVFCAITLSTMSKTPLKVLVSSLSLLFTHPIRRQRDTVVIETKLACSVFFMKRSGEASALFLSIKSSIQTHGGSISQCHAKPFLPEICVDMYPNLF